MRKALLLIAALVIPSIASATTVRLYSEKEMVQHAAAIVRGHVVSVTPRWYDQNTIVTDITIKVDRVLKGNKLRKLLSLVQYGGIIGDKAQAIAGNSEYTPGEEIIVFLETGGGGWVELGVGAGKFSISRASGKPMVQRQLGTVTFAKVVGKAARVVQPPKLRGPEPLATLERRIEEHLVK